MERSHQASAHVWSISALASTPPRMESARPKRFYKTAALVAQDAGFAVALDGRVVKTPEKRPLALPTRALGEAVAAEWDAQGDYLDLAAMHLTRLANVALDRTPETRRDMAEEIARYAETDLLCHLAEGPSDLRARQEAGWGPIRAWAEQDLGVALVPVEGVVAARQPSTSLEAVRGHALGLDDFRLTGLAYTCGILGSALLALAVQRGRVEAEAAFDLSRIDEDYQIERWGEDAEAAQSAANKRIEIIAVKAWFGALSSA